MKKIDVIIVGGGFVGLSFARSLRQTTLSVAVIETKPAPVINNNEVDQRALVLAASSQVILENYGIWKSIAPGIVPLHDIHVSEQSRFGVVRINASQERVPALGYVVDANVLLQALYQAVKTQANVILLHEAMMTYFQQEDYQPCITVKTKKGDQRLQADLVVAADGAHSTVCELAGLGAKKWGEGYQSLMANIVVDRPNGIVYERFIGAGAIAMVPRKKDYKCIITFPDERINPLLQLKDAAFLQKAQRLFGYRLGKWLSVKHRQVFPLAIVQREQTVRSGLVVIGNAAHTVYPVAAQGFNLGLRDVAILSDIIVTAYQANKKIGTLQVLQEYEKLRAKDQAQVIKFTERLLKCQHMRRWGLLAVELLPFVKRRLARQSMGIL